MLLRANAKINWGLNILGLREDGYHLLDMLMQTIELGDDLRLERAGEITLTVNGVPQPNPSVNLVVRAARALNAYVGGRNGVAIELTKRVPERAGLGGGSADCALTLMGLNRLWGLELNRDELLDIGLTLGADVPFCLTGGLAGVSGVGETLRPMPDAPEIPLALVRVGGGLSTGAVFSLWDRGGWPEAPLDVDALAGAVMARDLARVDALCANALTAPAVSLMPGIGRAIDRLRDLGARAAFMTGSGSAVVGAFDTEAEARAAAGAIEGAVFTRTLSQLQPCPWDAE